MVVVIAVASSAIASPQAPKVSVEGPSVKGALKARTIQEVLERGSLVLLDCYRHALASDSNLAGAVTTVFTSDVRGAVVAARARGPGEQLPSCVAGAISKLRFAVPPDGRSVQVTSRVLFGWEGALPAASASSTGGTIGTGPYGTIPRGGAGYGMSGPPRSGARGRHVPQPPSVRRGAPSIRGGADPAMLRRFFARKMNSLLTCYEEALRHDAALKGTAMVTFAIDAMGTVIAFQSNGVEGRGFADCIAGVIRSLRFPRMPRGSAVVTYPLTFDPGG